MNALRNKCAHDLAFAPSDREMSAIVTALGQLSPPVHTDAEDYPSRRVADLLEERAIALGAITPTPSNQVMQRTAPRSDA
ncbi:MAG: hypothetical protein DME97_13445 [Verrucomicrobia bacterium]|nr:MAG: hypothetical protein DME97_13445 [Verrucomicrobiota bacterium]